MSLLNLAVNNRLEIKEGAREGTGGGADFDQLSSMEHRLSVVVVHLCALMCTKCVRHFEQCASRGKYRDSAVCGLIVFLPLSPLRLLAAIFTCSVQSD